MLKTSFPSLKSHPPSMLPDSPYIDCLGNMGSIPQNPDVLKLNAITVENLFLKNLARLDGVSTIIALLGATWTA